MNCADFEILLCDYLDGTLTRERRREIDEHMSVCAACAAMAADVQGALGFMERAAVAEPPAELLTRILHDIPGHNAAGKRTWWRRAFGGRLEGLLQPRYVMGMAMTVLSFSLLARSLKIEPRQLRPSDLDPAKIWMAMDDRAHRAWDRTVKYYDNLKLVIEIQGRLQEWTEQDASRSPGKAQAGNDRKGAATTPQGGRK